MSKITDLDLKCLKEKNYNLKKALRKINKGYPVQYLIGHVNFFGYKIIVNENVLIPRFETEYLIEKTLKYLKSLNPKIIDLGTGSGCIAIALKKELIASEVTAIDISKKALKVAKKNAQLNNILINFKNLKIEDELNDKYDLIISNPPYIAYDGEVSIDVKKYEPHKALFAPQNGLYFYEEILKKSINHLNKEGFIALEIGESQKSDLTNLIKKYYPKAKFLFEKDLNNKDRYLFIFPE